MTETPRFIGIDPAGPLETCVVARYYPDGTIEIVDEYTIISTERHIDGSFVMAGEADDRA
ncbi:MAG: hypothetical protein AAFW60_01890 [Pseudomonadota bacterium]